MGNMVQSNSISDAFYTAFSVPKWVMGVIVAVLAAFIFIGGISRIASFTEKVVPVMAALYLVGALVVILINIQHVPSAIASIFICAFRPDAVFGAAAGITVRKAMRYGVARGLFSNEAGMGSTPHAHAIADVENPEDQGEVAMIGVFIDTFVVLTMTALVILSSGVLEEMMSTGVKGTPVAQAAFRTGLKGFGPGVRSDLSSVLCILDHRRMVLLRKTERTVSVRKESSRSVLADRRCVRFPRLSAESGSRMEPVRPL